MRRACFYISVAAMVALAVWLTFTGRLQNYLPGLAVGAAGARAVFHAVRTPPPGAAGRHAHRDRRLRRVARRALFNFIPQMQPVTAPFVMIMGVCSGPPAGFMTGALSALVSNYAARPGPVDGVADARLGPDRPVRRLGRTRAFRNRWALAGISVPPARFTALSSISDRRVARQRDGARRGALAFATGLLFSIPHMAGNFVFILLLYRPIAKKADRVGRKYGILLQKY